MRTIDADAFDRWLASAEFDAAMNECVSQDKTYEHIPMLYSTTAFRAVMENRPTVDAIPVEWLEFRRECEAADVVQGIEGIGDADICHSISVVLDLWNKETKCVTTSCQSKTGV